MPTRARMDALREFGVIGQAEIFKIAPQKILVRDGWNPRIDFDIADLAANIRVNGVKRPLLVKRGDDGHYTLVDGERRLRAVLACIADGCEILSVPCLVEPPRTSDAESLVDALVSNQGKPFTPEEEAEAFRRFVAWEWDIAKIAQRVGRSQSYVRDRLRILDAAAPVLEAARNGDIPWTAVTHIVRNEQEPAAQAAMVVTVQEARQERLAQRAERKAAQGTAGPRRVPVSGDERFTPAEKQVFTLVDALGIGDVLTHLARWCELEQHVETAAVVREVAQRIGVDMDTDDHEAVAHGINMMTGEIA
mgnify:CR=1 FL=1